MKASNFHLLMYVIILFMGILPVHKTKAAVRYGSLSLLFTKKKRITLQIVHTYLDM